MSCSFSCCSRKQKICCFSKGQNLSPKSYFSDTGFVFIIKSMLEPFILLFCKGCLRVFRSARRPWLAPYFLTLCSFCTSKFKASTLTNFGPPKRPFSTMGIDELVEFINANARLASHHRHLITSGGQRNVRIKPRRRARQQIGRNFGVRTGFLLPELGTLNHLLRKLFVARAKVGAVEPAPS